MKIALSKHSPRNPWNPVSRSVQFVVAALPVTNFSLTRVGKILAELDGGSLPWARQRTSTAGEISRPPSGMKRDAGADCFSRLPTAYIDDTVLSAKQVRYFLVRWWWQSADWLGIY